LGTMVTHRKETRRQRYDKKNKTAKKYPISLCAVNFRVDDNLGYLIRSAACFGAERLYVIGHVPDRSCVKASSGSLSDYVEIVQFSKPSEFLTYTQSEGISVVCGELVEGAGPLPDYDFDFARHVCLVVGNEETGVPVEILAGSDIIYVPMPGVGFCLNTSQAANIMLYEAVKQYEYRNNISH
jgi:tRNA G18 (ribose-2'-O)-methylase SpoU